MPSKREWLLVVPLLSLLLIVPFWQVATMQGVVITNDIAVSDMANLHHPVRHFLGRELHAGRLPLWLPDVYTGYPIQAEGMMGALYPPNLLLFGLLPPLPAINLAVLWPFFVAAFATYALSRRLGAALWPSLVAAVAYALGGYYIVHLKHLPIVHTACWIPLVWLLIELGLGGKRRYLLLAGLIWAIQWLAGSPQLAYYSTGAGIAYYLGRAIQTRQVRKTALVMALALLLSLGLAAIQIWPTAELTGFSERAGGVGFDFASSFGYQLESLKTLLYPYANGDPGTASYQIQGLFWEDYAYIGLLPLFAGLFGGMWLARKSGLARLLLLIAGVSFLVGLGENTPLFRLAYTWIPGMDLFRFPQRLQAVMTLCLVLAAALSLTRFQDWLAGTAVWENWSARISLPFLSGVTLLGVGMLTLVVADLYFYHIRQNAIVDAQAWYDPPQTAQRIQQGAGPSLPQDAALDLPKDRVFSFGVVTEFHEAYEEAGGWEADLQPYLDQREFLQPDLNILYDVPAADGYLNLTPGNLTQVWGNEKGPGFIETLFYRTGDWLMARPGFGRLLSLYNVRYLIVPMQFQHDGFELLGIYGSDAYLYENQNVLPRAFAVPGFRLAPNTAAALEAMVAPDFDPEREVLLVVGEGREAIAPGEGSASLDPAGFSASVEVIHYEPLRVIIDAETNQPGFLVLSDLYYPGWEATADGEPVPIYEASAAVRAVPLEAGAHTVEFRFRPRPLLYGAVVSLASALVLVAVWKRV
jgi:hypothetical protein